MRAAALVALGVAAMVVAGPVLGCLMVAAISAFALVQPVLLWVSLLGWPVVVVVMTRNARRRGGPHTSWRDRR